MLFNSSISCVITNYNHNKYINNTIKTVFEQSIKFDQVIVVDDGSNDNSLKTLNLLNKKYKFKLLKNKKNLGINLSFNKALRHIKTKFLFTMAMDDIYSKNLVKYFKSSLEKYSKYNPSIILGHAEGTHKDKKKIYQNFGFSKTKYFNKFEFLNFYSRKPFEVFGGNAFLDVQKTKKFGGYLKELYWHSDWMLYFLLLIDDGMLIFPKKIVNRRITNDSYSSNMKNVKYETKIILNFLKILRKKFKKKYKVFKKYSIIPSYHLDVFFYLLKKKHFREYITLGLLLKILSFNIKRILRFLRPGKFKIILKNILL